MQIILRLPDDADVGNELWDQVIEAMMHRVKDKVPGVRICAIRALSRFVNESENSDILELFLEAASLEQNAVRPVIIGIMESTCFDLGLLSGSFSHYVNLGDSVESLCSLMGFETI